MNLCVLSIVILVALVAAVGPASVSGAELGRENVAVVYNARSVASRTIAQAWMRERGLNYAQAIPLTDVSWYERTDLDVFRRQVLDPIEAALRERGLEKQISVIAYAPDLPLNIWFTTPRVPNGQRGPGAVTGMTLLAPKLSLGWQAFTAPNANSYVEQMAGPGGDLNQRAEADPRAAAADARMADKDLAGGAALYAALAAEIPAPSILYNLACAQALQKKDGEALATLDRAVSAGWNNARHSQSDSDLEALRMDPAWPQLIVRMQANAALRLPGPSRSFTMSPAVTEAGGGQSPPGRLAMVLAVTCGRGQAIDEAVAGLIGSVHADGTRPAGTVWLMASKDDARTGPRLWAFQGAATALNAAGVKAEVVEDILPPSGAPVIGAMIGASDFDWAKGGAKILPGAWCDHLTSWSGAMQPGGGQTPITVYLQAGASGSGGAVHEPFNIPLKFPSAFIHLHRVRGLSLVEAVYYTMSMPFQFLAVGDPLSRPWTAVKALPASAIPASGMALTTPQQVVRGAPLTCTLSAPAGANHVLAHLGRILVRVKPGETTVTVDTRQFGFGISDLILGTATTDNSIVEVARAAIRINPPAALPALPEPAASAPRWRFTEQFWPVPEVLYPGSTGPGTVCPTSSDEGWLQVSEGGLHQVAWTSSRLLAFSWDNGPERPAGDGPDSEPVVLAPGWHFLRVRFAPGDAWCEVRFGRHGTMPIEAARWPSDQK